MGLLFGNVLSSGDSSCCISGDVSKRVGLCYENKDITSCDPASTCVGKLMAGVPKLYEEDMYNSSSENVGVDYLNVSEHLCASYVMHADRFMLGLSPLKLVIRTCDSLMLNCFIFSVHLLNLEIQPAWYVEYKDCFLTHRSASRGTLRVQ